MGANNLGKYRLVAELARGGMGVVWLAEVRGPGGFAKTCVVKELLPELANDPHHRAMFLDEASLAARLTHKNIVQTNEVGSEGARLFMALELLDGCSLRRVQTLLEDAAGARIPTALAVRIVSEVLGALEYAHGLRDEAGAPLGIVHRDVTPQNVFLTFDGQVKLLDFGVAKSKAVLREKTREGIAKGCIAYMSPDHVAVEPIDHRADIFAAGVLLRELLTGTRLWGDHVSDGGIIHRLVAHDVPFFPIDKSVPSELRRICETAMSPNRNDRFATARHMREALDWWLGSFNVEGSLTSDLTALFEGPLTEEQSRIHKLHHPAPPTTKRPPPPLPPRATITKSADATMELDVTDFVDPLGEKTRALVVVASPSPSPPPTKPRRFPKREAFVAIMAIIASIAATVAVVTSILNDDTPTPTAHEIVIVSPNTATKVDPPKPE